MDLIEYIMRADRNHQRIHIQYEIKKKYVLIHIFCLSFPFCRIEVRW